MGYWAYYLVWLILAYGLHNPLLLGGVVVFLLLRRVLPAPGPLLSALSRIRALRAQVDANPANVPARRELAELYIGILRPGRALVVLEQARAREPDSAELLFLTGLALYKKRRHEAALAPLVAAVERDARVRFGEPYRIAGYALMALRRYAEAEDAFERYADANTSSVDGQLQLAVARARQGRREEARVALGEALATWRQIPRALRRRQLGAWVSAQWARVWLAREPGALALALVLLALCAGGAALAVPRLAAALETGAAARRFERLPAAAAAGTALVKNRWALGHPGDPDQIETRTLSVGDFVCRLWAVFGPPDRRPDGFSYVFRDRETGRIVTAFASGAGPAFGARPGDGDRSLPSILALDALVERAKPVDCRIDYQSEDGAMRSGVQGGVAFDDAAGPQD